jgi:DNA repair exonuclease SbcCD ATPase subunit
MKLHDLLVCGLTEAFPNQVTVNFEALGPGLIALVGENGAGKSTLIGSVFAALFRQLPGQKRSLYDFCTNSQPEIDLTFSVNGNRYRSLLRIDPKSRQMESYLNRLPTEFRVLCVRDATLRQPAIRCTAGYVRWAVENHSAIA